MIELSLHILDIVENSIAAGAEVVDIRIQEDREKDIFTIEIRDDGRGMDEQMKKKVLDPFVTTKPRKKVGLGLSLLAEAARKTGGRMEIHSELDQGTHIVVTFGWSHVDRQPLGDMIETLVLLMIGNPDVEFVYEHTRDGKSFSMDTRDIQEHLGEIPRSTPDVLDFIREHLKTGLREIGVHSQ